MRLELALIITEKRGVMMIIARLEKKKGYRALARGLKHQTIELSLIVHSELPLRASERVDLT